MLTNMLTEMNKESSNARCRKRDKLGADWFFEGKLTSQYLGINLLHERPFWFHLKQAICYRNLSISFRAQIQEAASLQAKKLHKKRLKLPVNSKFMSNLPNI